MFSQIIILLLNLYSTTINIIQVLILAITITLLSALFFFGIIEDQQSTSADNTVSKMTYKSQLEKLSDEKKLILLTQLNTIINQKLTNDRLLLNQNSKLI